MSRGGWIFCVLLSLLSLFSLCNETVINPQHFNTELVQVLLNTRVSPSIAVEVTTAAGWCMLSLHTINSEGPGLLLE